MSNLSIYNSEKQSLTSVSFLKDVSTHIKIREITDVSEFNTSIGNLMQQIINHLAIKEAVSKTEKDDVKEMILMRFKHLSLDEMAYAFKLERYGMYSDKTDHYQLFNAEYVSTILGKYEKWKVSTIKLHNLNTPRLPEQAKITESEKKELFVKTLEDEFKNYKENGVVNDMRNWLYDELVKCKLVVSDPFKKIAWKHSIQEVKKIQSGLRKRDKYNSETLKSKAVIIYKCKLIENIFKQFTTFEQLKNKL